METVEGGIMTKDLAINVHNDNNVSEKHYVDTLAFIEAVRDRLRLKL